MHFYFIYMGMADDTHKYQTFRHYTHTLIIIITHIIIHITLDTRELWNHTSSQSIKETEWISIFSFRKRTFLSTRVEIYKCIFKFLFSKSLKAHICCICCYNKLRILQWNCNFFISSMWLFYVIYLTCVMILSNAEPVNEYDVKLSSTINKLIADKYILIICISDDNQINHCKIILRQISAIDSPFRIFVTKPTTNGLTQPECSLYTVEPR